MGKFSDRLVSGSLYSFASLVGINILTFIYSMILYRVLIGIEGEELAYSYIGVFGWLREFGQIAVPLLILGLNTAMAKYIPEYLATKKDKVEALINTSFYMVLIGSILGGIAYFIFSDVIALILGEQLISTLMKINVVYVTLIVIISVMLGVMQGFQKFKLLAKLNVMNAIISIPTLILFAMYFSIEGVVLGGAINITIFFFIIAYFFRDTLKKNGLKFKLKWDREVTKDLFKFTPPLIMSIIILRPAHLFGRSYLGMVTDWGVDMGYYKIAFTFYAILLYIPAAVSIPLIPMISELDAKNPQLRAQLVSRIIKVGIFIMLPFSIMFALLSPAFIWVLTGDPNSAANEIVFLMAMTAIMMAFFAFAGGIMTGTGKTMQLLYIDIFHSIIFVGLSYYLINQYGLAGLGWAWLLIPIILIAPYIIYLYRIDYIQLRPIGEAMGVTAVFVTLTFMTHYWWEDYTLIMLYLIIIPLVAIEYNLLSDKDKKLIDEWMGKLRGKLGGGGGKGIDTVVIVTNVYHPIRGGITTYIDNLTRFLAKSGYRTDVIAYPHWMRFFGDNIRSNTIRRTYKKLTYVLFISYVLYKALGYLPARRRMVLHSINSSFCTTAVGLANAVFGFKIVHTFLSDLSEGSGERMDYNKSMMRIRTFDQFLNRMSAVTFVSENLRKTFETKVQTRSVGKNTVIHNSVDADEFKAVRDCDEIRVRYSLKKPVFLFVGYLVESKSPRSFVLALAELKRSGRKFSGIIIGRGPLEKELRELIAKHELEEHVTIINDVPRMQPFYTCADVLVLPSMAEGLPTVVLEANACNTAVIATAATGTPEVVEHNVNGLLITSNEPAEIYNAMKKIMMGGAHRKMGKAGRKLVKRKFSWQVNIKKFIEIYEK